MGKCIEQILALAFQAGLSLSRGDIFQNVQRTATSSFTNAAGEVVIRTTNTSFTSMNSAVRQAHPDLGNAWSNCTANSTIKVNVFDMVLSLVELIAPPPLKPVINIVGQVINLIVPPPFPPPPPTLLCPWCVTVGGIPILTLIMLAIAITLKIVDDVQLRTEIYITLETRGNLWRQSNQLKSKQGTSYAPVSPDGDGIKSLPIKQPLPTQNIVDKIDPFTVDLVEYWTISFSRGIGNAFAADIGKNDAEKLLRQTLAQSNLNNELVINSASLLTQFDTTIPAPASTPAPPALDVVLPAPSNKDEYEDWRDSVQDTLEYNTSVLAAWKAANPNWNYNGPRLPTVTTDIASFVKWAYPDNGQNAQVAIFYNGCKMLISPKRFSSTDFKIQFINTKPSVSEGFDIIPRAWITHVFSCSLQFKGDLYYPSWIGQNPDFGSPIIVPISAPPSAPGMEYFPPEEMGFATESNTMDYRVLLVKFLKRRPYADLSGKTRTLLTLSAGGQIISPPWEYQYAGVDLRNHGFTGDKALQTREYGSSWRFPIQPSDLPPPSDIAIRVINSDSIPYEDKGVMIIDQIGVIKNSGGTLGAFKES